MAELSLEDKLTVIRSAFAGIAAGSAEEMLVDNYTDDVVLELPYADPPSAIETKATAIKYLTGAFSMLRFSLDIHEIHECANPNQVILEYTSDGTVLATGKKYTNRYIAIYWFRDGLICRVREFYNPVISAAALA